MDRILNDAITAQIKKVFDDQLKNPVKVLFFGRQTGCDTCNDTRQLMEEVTAISDKLHFEAFDIEEDAEIARQYNVDKAPGLVLTVFNEGQITDYGVRFAGIPSGHEFSTLIHDLVLVSGRDSGLSPETRKVLKKLDKPVHLQVFVTPTWPYCPRAVVLAHQMAIESPFVQAEMVEAMEFPDLSNEFNVSGVPQTTINMGAGTTIGAVPEEDLLDEIQRALVAV